MKRIGVVGGVGPHAALHFYQRLLRLRPAATESDYPAVVLVADQVPSRIDHLLGPGEDPLPVLLGTVRALERAGVDVIAIPSATTHAYWSMLSASTSVPMTHLLVETGRALRQARHRRPLILATEATATLGFFEPFVTGGRDAVHYPDKADQRKVSWLIDRIKRGGHIPDLRAEFTEWLERTVNAKGFEDRAGAAPDCVVLGCTELSLIAPQVPVGLPVVDVTEVLAAAVLDGRHTHAAHNELEAMR